MSGIITVRLPDGTERDALDMDFTVKNEEWNEYNLDDGTTVHLKTPAIRIFRLLDDDGEPSFTDEGEPELFVWQNTTAMRPGAVQAALVETAPEQTNGDRQDALPSSKSFGSARSHPVGVSTSSVTPGAAYGGNAETSERPQGKPRNYLPGLADCHAAACVFVSTTPTPPGLD